MQIRLVYMWIVFLVLRLGYLNLEVVGVNVRIDQSIPTAGQVMLISLLYGLVLLSVSLS